MVDDYSSDSWSSTEEKALTRSNLEKERALAKQIKDQCNFDEAATMEEKKNFDILKQRTNAKSRTHESINSTEERMSLVVKCVRAVPDLVPKSELYWASLDFIATNDVARAILVALPDDEKVPFLKWKTKESRNYWVDHI